MMHPSLLSFAVWAQYFVTFGASLPGCIRTLATRGAAHLPLVWRCKDLFQRQIRSGFDTEILQGREIAQNIGVSFQGHSFHLSFRGLRFWAPTWRVQHLCFVWWSFMIFTCVHGITPSFSSPRSQWVGDLHCCWGSLKERQVSQLKMGFAGVKWSRFGCFPLVPTLSLGYHPKKACAHVCPSPMVKRWETWSTCGWKWCHYWCETPWRLQKIWRHKACMAWKNSSLEGTSWCGLLDA